MSVGQTVLPLRIDAEFRSLIPPLSDEELRQLEENIKADGCRDPLVRWGDTLVDGHNRHAICERHGIDFQTVEHEFSSRDEALLWIIDNQKGRRNIADIDRIALAAKRESIFSKRAKAQQVRKPISVSANLPKQNPIETRRESAKAAGVGERTYDAGKLVLKAAAEGKIKPEVIEDIRRGRAAIHRVAKEVKESSQREERKAKRVEAAKDSPSLDSRIVIGDFRQNADKVADGSVSLIFTDPPYDREASKMLPALGEFAAAKLADGGSLILYVGQTQIPAALDALRPHLRYWWTIACVHAGRATVMREYGINAKWKAVLWFVKGTRDDNSTIVNDVMSGGTKRRSN